MVSILLESTPPMRRFMRGAATALLLSVSLSHAATAAARPEMISAAPLRTQRAVAEVSFGIKAGVSLSQHTGTEERDPEYSVASRWRSGFVASVFAFLPITPRFGIQQELAYVQKGSRQDIGVDILDIPTVLNVTYDMDYIEIPVLLRFAWAMWRGNTVYSFAGTALSLKVRDRYLLAGEIDDGTQTVPLRADADMSEVDMFDYSFVYGLGLELTLSSRKLLLEHRFIIGWNTLAMPTYAYVPFGDDRILIENGAVPLKNQTHLILVGIRF
jgi:hypothetical protein